MLRGGRTYYIAHDQLGSVRQVIDVGTGVVAQALDYDVHGVITRNTNPNFQPFGYAGGLTDLDGRAVHFGARDYDPRTARWLQPDPIGALGGANRYTYAENDPVNLTDPSGLDVICTYVQRTGQLTCTDTKTGRQVKTSAESGGKPFGDPIPPGPYEILERQGRDDFFRLDAVDKKPRDDVHEPSGRDHFRLHKPGRTIGCIAVKQPDDWQTLKRLLNDTDNTTVPDNYHPWWKIWYQPVPIKKFGTLTVK
jgi:RHS repeat-associated protein